MDTNGTSDAHTSVNDDSSTLNRTSTLNGHLQSRIIEVDMIIPIDYEKYLNRHKIHIDSTFATTYALHEVFSNAHAAGMGQFNVAHMCDKYHRIVKDISSHIDAHITEDEFHAQKLSGLNTVSMRDAQQLIDSVNSITILYERKDRLYKFIKQLCSDLFNLRWIEFYEQITIQCAIDIRNGLTHESSIHVSEAQFYEHYQHGKSLISHNEYIRCGINARRHDAMLSTMRRVFDGTFVETIVNSTISSTTSSTTSSTYDSSHRPIWLYPIRECARIMRIRALTDEFITQFYSETRPLDVNIKHELTEFITILNQLSRALHKLMDTHRVICDRAPILLGEMLKNDNNRCISVATLHQHEVFVASRNDSQNIGLTFETDFVTLAYKIEIARIVLGLPQSRILPLIDKINSMMRASSVTQSQFMESSKLAVIISQHLEVQSRSDMRSDMRSDLRTELLHSVCVELPPDETGRSGTEFDTWIALVNDADEIEDVWIIEIKLNPNDINVGVYRKQATIRRLDPKTPAGKSLFAHTPRIPVKIGACGISPYTHGYNQLPVRKTIRYVTARSFRRFHTTPFMNADLYLSRLYFITKDRHVANVEEVACAAFVAKPINFKYAMISTALHRNVMPDLYATYLSERNAGIYPTFMLLPTLLKDYPDKFYFIPRSYIPY